uniref:Replication-associated protein n=1 Tax=Anser anser CRESS-DNA-virus sp. TaxID=2815022 RepID=A0A8A4XB81_9VIRU|nr:MAG: replication-associated protein [Anser anser CRESS-DNA-virus sp.]
MVNATRTRAWMITWNNYTPEDIEFWKSYVPDKCEQWAWQLEVAPTTGTPHIQAALYFKAQRTFTAIKKDLPKCNIQAVENWAAASTYCQKVKSRDESEEGDANIIDKKKEKEKPKVTVKDPMDGINKKQWQIDIDTIIEKPAEVSDRKIYWYYDINGAAGKTTYAKHLAIRLVDRFLYLGGKANDIKSAIAQMVEKGNNPDVCIFDFVRSCESHISYDAIESVKNGIFFSGKYESNMVVFNTPHVIIFANFKPDLDKLSRDRWVIRSITED